MRKGRDGNEVAMAANRMKAGQLCALRLPINNALIKCASGGADGLARFNCRSIGPARTSWPGQKLAKTNLKQEQNVDSDMPTFLHSYRELNECTETVYFTIINRNLRIINYIYC